MGVMSEYSPPESRPRGARRVRGLLAVVAAGALAASMIGVTSDEDGSTHLRFGLRTDSGKNPHDSVFDAVEAGTCLRASTDSDPAAGTGAGGTGDAEGIDLRGLRTVDCDETHGFEVTRRIDHDGDSPGPRYASLKDEVCPAAATEYTNGRWDPAGRFAVNILDPGRRDNGAHPVFCVLMQRESTGRFIQSAAPVLDTEQTWTEDPGVCLAADGTTGNRIVDCTRPHTYEVTSVVDLAPTFPDRAPSAEDQAKHLAEKCHADAVAYLGDDDTLWTSTLDTFWVGTLGADSWKAGSRKINCVLMKRRGDGRFAEIAGPAKSGFTIDGKAPEKRAPRPPITRRPGN